MTASTSRVCATRGACVRIRHAPTLFPAVIPNRMRMCHMAPSRAQANGAGVAGFVRARVLGLSKIKQINAEVDRVWSKYDSTGDGSLTMEEALELLNSVELADFVEKATAVRPLVRSMEDMQQLFRDADGDDNNRLSKMEFMAMYMNVVASRVQADPKVLAQALLGILDTDRNGVLEGQELKRLLRLVGVPFYLTMPLPDSVKLDYTKAAAMMGLPPPTPKI